MVYPIHLGCSRCSIPEGCPLSALSSKLVFWIFVLAGLTSCSSLNTKLAEEPPPLADMEVPLDLLDEPEDEALRLELKKGAFSGIYVKEGSESLDEMLDEEGGGGVLVDRVVENSPGAKAKVRKGDILLEAKLNEAQAVELSWPSEWRKLELEGSPGGQIRILLDRAGREFSTTVKLEERVATTTRHKSQNFREEQKVGLVLRTATEVESRAAGLGPGGGAVVVGLSKASPWRKAGLRFKDMIVEVDGKPVAHPQVLLEAIKAKEAGDKLDLVVQRGDVQLNMAAGLTDRASEFERFSIPILFSHEAKGENSDTSFLFGLLGYQETAAAWEFTFLWFIKFGGGDSDELEEVDS